MCFLFNGDVQIEVEEDLDVYFLKAHGHFEFVFRRVDKRVCIVEAKKDDMSQGMAQDLLGCEVAAEIGHLDIVYGIVTNYVQWNFLHSLDEKIEMEKPIYETYLFSFPFNRVELDRSILIQLQKPPDVNNFYMI